MADRRSRGIKHITSGVVLIGIGLAMGGSVFTGDASLLDWVFDGLGMIMIGRGVLAIATPEAA